MTTVLEKFEYVQAAIALVGAAVIGVWAVVLTYRVLAGLITDGQSEQPEMLTHSELADRWDAALESGDTESAEHYQELYESGEFELEFCPECGAGIPENYSFICQECGAPIEQP